MRERISRGEFVYGIAVAGLVAAASCLAPPAPTAPSQSAAPAEGVRRERLPVIGYLAFGVPQVPALVRLRESFRLGLQNFGWEDGKNVVVEYRYAEGQAARVPELVSELVSLPVDLILAADSNVVPAAKEATSTIPIVMALFSDPVGAGLAQSLARPGGSVTGMSNLNRPLAAKRVETLRELLPELNRAAVLWNSQPPGVRLQWQEVERVARVLRLEMQSLPLRGGNELETAFQAASMEGAEALLVLPDPLTLSHGSEIVRLAAQYRLPALYGASDIVTEEGGLMSLAADRFGMMRRTGFYVDRILTGTSPAELPIDQATRFELVINLRTAQALGLTVPSELLLDATEEIQ